MHYQQTASSDEESDHEGDEKLADEEEKVPDSEYESSENEEPKPAVQERERQFIVSRSQHSK
jgi:hypothetical protein